MILESSISQITKSENISKLCVYYRVDLTIHGLYNFSSSSWSRVLTAFVGFCFFNKNGVFKRKGVSSLMGNLWQFDRHFFGLAAWQALKICINPVTYKLFPIFHKNKRVKKVFQCFKVNVSGLSLSMSHLVLLKCKQCALSSENFSLLIP